MNHAWITWPLDSDVNSFPFLIRIIKPFLIVMFKHCKNYSSVINLTYCKQLQFSHNCNKLECLSLSVPGQETIFRVEFLMGHYSKYRLLPLPENIRLGCKWLTVINTLAYYDTEFISSKKFENTGTYGECNKKIWYN